MTGPVTLRNEVFVAVEDSLFGSTRNVRAFTLPGREVAGQGWVTLSGKMTKEGRPR